MSQSQITTSLFGTITIERRSRKEALAIRRKKAKQALAHANELWVTEYTNFILEFGKTNESFTAEDVRLEYLKQSKVRTTAEQASGGIFQRLVREGKLIKSGTATSTKYGNILQAYSLRESK